MLHVFEFFSNKSDSTLRNKNGAKLYTSLPPFSHLLFYSPRSFFIHFSLDIPHRILWRVLFFERILSESFSSSLNISKSNWKYSTLVASCFYIYLHFAIGFFRLWLSKPPPSPLSQDAFGIHRVFAYALHQKICRNVSPLPSPNIYFSPADRFKASGSKNTYIYITFIGEIRAFAFPFVYVTRLQLSVNLLQRSRPIVVSIVISL